MRALLVSILTLVSLAGCLQATSPIQSIHYTTKRAWTAAAATGQPDLHLSVRTSTHIVTAGGIIGVTLVFSAAGDEPVVVGPGDDWVLDLDTLDGQRVVRYGPYSLFTHYPRIVNLELPAFSIGPSRELVPYEPGMYRLTLSLVDVPAQSPPCTFKIVAPRDPAGQVAAP
jgi:ABC-type Fe3+-hydroxamate transport system substrate-binding protein